MTVQVLYIHFSASPGIVRWRLPDDCATLLVFGVESVDVVHRDIHPGSRLPLAAFAEKNADFTTTDTTERWGIVPVPFLLKTEFGDVVVHRCGEVLHIEDRRNAFELVHMNS